MSSDDRQTTAPAALVPMHCLRFSTPGPPQLAALHAGTPVSGRSAATRTSARCSPTPGSTRVSLHAPAHPTWRPTRTCFADPNSILNAGRTEKAAAPPPCSAPSPHGPSNTSAPR